MLQLYKQIIKVRIVLIHKANCAIPNCYDVFNLQVQLALTMGHQRHRVFKVLVEVQPQKVMKELNHPVRVRILVPNFQVKISLNLIQRKL